MLYAMGANVPTSVMPKGVEHTVTPVQPEPYGNVPTSVMPKGVEHAVNPSLLGIKSTRADLCDAERR